MAEQAKRRKVTINTLMAKKKRGEPITQLAAYDYRTAIVSDRLGMDILCVSDTGGMILFGHQSTVTVSFEEVMMMAQAIDRGSKYGLRMVDMPYWSFHVSKEQAIENAGRFVQQANAEVMKCEGNRHHAPNIEAIVNAGIPVQGHIGITPMRMPQLGGFIAQGKTSKRAQELIDDAKAMYDAGCFSILCEVTTSEVAEYLAEILPIPIISLGAGNRADGVHIISSDLFHLWEEHVPKHSRIYTDLIPIMEDVITRYMKDVVDRDYPGPKETINMPDEELLAFAQAMKWERKIDEIKTGQKKAS
ncbi:MAG: 3-methyl-2-oxobutanoate hydroxymethyltransferase [Hyphomicrobiaceae bacterium]